MKAFTIFSKHTTSFRCFSTTPKIYKFQSAGDLRNKSVLITGASRGIGLAIGTRLAKDGANVTILAKSVAEDPRIPGTIYTAAAQIQKAGGNALALQCDIRDEAQVRDAVEKAAKTFGGIDILINNASAISLTGTMETEMKRYDLMQAINTRGTFVTSKYCLSYLLKAENPHILNLAPPLDMQPKWFGPHVAYSIAKFGMSLCVLGMSDEFKDKGVAVNALWPRTLIATAAVKNVLGGDSAVKKSRTEEIVADAAYVILSNKSTNLTGQFFIDEDVLRSAGVTDFSKYRIDPSIKDEDLTTDLFLD